MIARTPCFRLRVVGREHLPHGACVVVANHASYLDAAYLVLALRRWMRFLVWETHYNTPGLGHVYRLLRCIPVEIWNEGPPIRREAYRTALTHLHRGGTLGVFPEGGRTPDGRFMRWRDGAARLALRAGVPLVPVTLNGAYEVWPMHRRWPRPGVVEVVIHPPLWPQAYQGLRPRQAAQLMIDAARRLVAAVYQPPAAEHLPPPDWPNPHLTHPRGHEAFL